MTKVYGETIGKALGTGMGVDIDKDSNIEADYQRIRVSIDVSKPLRRGIGLKLPGESAPQWFYLQHERLPNFCYHCGLWVTRWMTANRRRKKIQ